MPDRPGSRNRSRSRPQLVAPQLVGERRADVAAAQHDAVDVGPRQHPLGVGVVAEPEVAAPRGPRLARRADHADDVDALLAMGGEEVGERHRPAVGADDDHPPAEAARLALRTDPRAVDRAPADEGEPHRRAGDGDLGDVEVEVQAAIEHDRAEAHQPDGPSDPGQLDRPHAVEAAHPQLLAADGDHAEGGDRDRLRQQLLPGAGPDRRHREDHEVEAEQDGHPVTGDQDVLEVIGADAEQPARAAPPVRRRTAAGRAGAGGSATCVRRGDGIVVVLMVRVWIAPM